MTTPLERQLLSARLRPLVHSLFEGNPAPPEFAEVVLAIADGDERAVGLFKDFIEQARLYENPRTRTGNGAVAVNYIEKFIAGTVDVIGFYFDGTLPILPDTVITDAASCCRVSTEFDDEISSVLNISFDVTWDAHNALLAVRDAGTDLPPVVARLLDVVLDRLNEAWKDDVRAEFGPGAVEGDYPGSWDPADFQRPS